MRVILPAWYGHLEESFFFLITKLSSKRFACLWKAVAPPPPPPTPAENVNENPDYSEMNLVPLKL